MSEPTFTRKVYICSRQATPTSRSTSDFDISLSRNVVLPQKAAGFITDIQIPHSWYTVDEGQRFLYFKIMSTSTPPVTFGKIELAKENYTGEQLADAIRELMPAQLTVVGNAFYVQYDSAQHVLKYALSPAYNFAQTWTDAAGDTFILAAVTGGYSVTPRIVDYYDFSTPSWTNGFAVFSLAEKDNTTYEGDYYFLQGTWADTPGNVDYTVTASPEFSGIFTDNSGATLEVTAVSELGMQVTRRPDFRGLPEHLARALLAMAVA